MSAAVAETKLKRIKEQALFTVDTFGDGFALPGYLKLCTELLNAANFYIARLQYADIYTHLVRFIAVVKKVENHADSQQVRFRDQIAWCREHAQIALKLLEETRPKLLQQLAEAEEQRQKRSQTQPQLDAYHSAAPTLLPASPLRSAGEGNGPYGHTPCYGHTDRAPAGLPSSKQQTQAGAQGQYPAMGYISGQAQPPEQAYQREHMRHTSSFAVQRPDRSGLPPVEPGLVHAQHPTHSQPQPSAPPQWETGNGPAAQVLPLIGYGTPMDSVHGSNHARKHSRAPSYGALTKILISSSMSPGAAGAPLGDILRPLILPSELVAVFEQHAVGNSRVPPRGIETCGVLCGKMELGSDGASEVLRVSTLVLPAQQGGPDNCEVTEAGEMALLSVCQAEGLISLGWIHTHPSQDCFMSSLDCHTHCGYQSLLPEAVAVVISQLQGPKRRVGVFRLTDDTGPGPSSANAGLGGEILTGLSIIQACTQRGFHAHPEAEHTTLYEDCPHVQLHDAQVHPQQQTMAYYTGQRPQALQVRDLR